jgi:Zn-dependent metalloprotease
MNESPKPTERTSAAAKLLDELSVERLQKLIVIETADSATKSIIDRGKWMIGGVAALLAVLGFSTYSDVKKSVESITAEATKKVQTEASNMLAKFETDTSNTLAKFEKDTAGLQKKLAALDTELNDYRHQVALKAEQTMKEFDERRTFISSQVILNVTASPASRKVYSAENNSTLPGKLARSEGDKATGDALVDDMYDNLGTVLRFWKSEYGRSSYDGKGSEVRAVVRYQQNYNNTFWNGTMLVIGDGDGKIFKTFSDLKTVASELMHGVVQSTAGFRYEGQSGALNTHMSDVFGTMVEQWKLKQTADQANWLIGDAMLASTIKGVALRSLKAPGTAYDDPTLGKDPQPSTMAGYKDANDVHINSGIPNHAFYLAAAKIGGFAWEKAGKIWYQALLASGSKDDFRKFAGTTLAKAEALFGKQSKEWSAVKEAWHGVGIEVGS